MYFNFACTHCGKNLKVREEIAGRKARCPHCKTMLVVPQPSTPVMPDFPAENDLSQLNFNDPLAGFSAGADPLGGNPLAGAVATQAPPGVAIAPAPAAAQKAAVTAARHAEQTDGSNVSMIWTALVGLAATAIFYALLYPLPEMYFRDLFYARGWVTVAEAYLFFWSLAVLLFKSRKLKKQRDSMLFDLLPDSLGKDITLNTLGQFASNVRELPVQPGSSFLVQRVLRGLEHFGVRHSASEVSSVLSSQSEIDNAAVASSYAMLNVFIWAIPILGFIGTVQGLGEAVGSLSASLEGASDVESIKQSLGAITGGLGVAFDTTLVALIMALFLKFPASSLQKSEEDLLTWVDEYCNENLLKRLQDPEQKSNVPADPTSRALQKAIDAALVPHHAELRAWNVKLKEIGQAITTDVQQGWQAMQDQLQTQQGAQVALLGEVIERVSTAAAQIAENTDKLAALQQAQADQFVATAATLDAQGEAIEQQASEHRVAAEAQLADFVEQARQTLAPLAEHAQVSQGQIAAAVQQSTSSMEQSLASLREAVLNLNDVLGQLGGQQVVIQQTVAARRGWSLFGRNGKSHG